MLVRSERKGLKALARKTDSWDSHSKLTPTDCSHFCHATNRRLPKQLYQGLNTTIHLANIFTKRQRKAGRDTYPKNRQLGAGDQQIAFPSCQEGFCLPALWCGQPEAVCIPNCSPIVCRRAGPLTGPHNTLPLENPI